MFTTGVKTKRWTLSTGTTSGSANGTSGTTDFGNFESLMCYCSVGTVAGTSPTLDIDVQTSPDNTNYFKQTAFAQFTAIGTGTTSLSSFGRYTRYQWKVGGTEPAFGFTVDVIGKP